MSRKILHLVPAKTHRRASAFSLVELLVVIAIISVLVALLLPVLASAKEVARTVKCLSQQRQIAIAVAAYVNDSKEGWPTSSYPFCGHPYHYCALWAAVVAHYSPNPYITEYPTNADAYPTEVMFTSYTEPSKPNQGILKCPTDTTTNAWGGPTSVSYGYNGTFYGLGVNDYFSEPDADFYYGVNGPIYADGYGRQRSPAIRNFAGTVMVADINAQGGYEYSGYRLSNWAGASNTYDSLAVYHAGSTSNILWVDGHATTRKPAAMTADDFDRR